MSGDCLAWARLSNQHSTYCKARGQISPRLRDCIGRLRQIGAAMPFIRTCQECGYKLVCSRPKDGPLSNSYTNRKCPSCKSEAFDYGSDHGEDRQEPDKY